MFFLKVTHFLQLIVVAGMVRILAIKYFRYTYAPSKINTLQQAERLGGPILSLGNIERQQRGILKDVAPVSITQSKNINPVYEPLLSDSPSSRRLLGSGTSFRFLSITVQIVFNLLKKLVRQLSFRRCSLR